MLHAISSLLNLVRQRGSSLTLVKQVQPKFIGSSDPILKGSGKIPSEGVLR